MHPPGSPACCGQPASAGRMSTSGYVSLQLQPLHVVTVLNRSSSLLAPGLGPRRSGEFLRERLSVCQRTRRHTRKPQVVSMSSVLRPTVQLQDAAGAS